MTLFEDRERAFEQSFVHDEEARFRALAKRNRLLGQWAAEQLGLKGEKAGAYIDEVSQSVVARVVDETLVAKIQSDFEANAIDIPDDKVREKMSQLMAEAILQVRSNAW
ncbi:DUF1476 domain-containing protein [Microvirga puerhi]|uniref:DUF1476 domain-containing protein n=1 Tax=Microvirga puerhi TaxID=2876078 RepID=A0ABS7VK61_9HYPH|nr:DUF1476 domain-containing protein [Microvirga puerhi]MBZ6075911.1 DUF1476 domain-containing protein [Microvirga puerhi]